jgi:tetratricopeptide (TPR) repeat protein
MWLGTIYFFAGNYDESIECLNRTLALDSNFIESYAYLSYSYFLKGSFEKAVQYADKALSYGGTKNLPMIGVLGWVYSKSGEITKAKKILAHMVELSDNGNIDPIFFAAINDGLGEYEKVFYWLSKAYECHSGTLIYLNAFKNTIFKDISSDPRYVDLLEKVGFRKN